MTQNNSENMYRYMKTLSLSHNLYSAKYLRIVFQSAIESFHQDKKMLYY